MINSVEEAYESLKKAATESRKATPEELIWLPKVQQWVLEQRAIQDGFEAGTKEYLKKPSGNR